MKTPAFQKLLEHGISYLVQLMVCAMAFVLVLGCSHRSLQEGDAALPSGVRIMSRSNGIPSPDLNYIVEADPKGQLYLSRIDGGDFQPLRVWTSGSGFGGPSQVAWSPNGKRLAVCGYDLPDGQGPEQVYVFDTSPAKVNLLARFRGGTNRVVWSPDGSQICFYAPLPASESEYAIGDIRSRVATPLFRSRPERTVSQFRGREHVGEKLLRHGSIVLSGFEPKVWLPSRQDIAGIAIIAPAYSGSAWTFPGVLNLKSRSLAVLGEQQIVSIIGLDAAKQRLYCFFTKDSSAMASGSVPGWVSLNKSVYHFLALPGYYDVESEEGRKIYSDKEVESWQLISRDGFLVLWYASAISSDGRRLALWEQRFASDGRDTRKPAVRLTIWDISSEPKIHRAIEVDNTSYPSIFRLMATPSMFSFTSDNKSLIGWFDSGTVIQFMVDHS